MAKGEGHKKPRKRGKDTSEAGQLLTALRHPLRRLILREMSREGKSISTGELAGALKQPLSNVSYHVWVLADRGAIALAKTKPVRGSIQHFYRLSIEADWARNVLELDAEKDETKRSDSKV